MENTKQSSNYSQPLDANSQGNLVPDFSSVHSPQLNQPQSQQEGQSQWFPLTYQLRSFPAQLQQQQSSLRQHQSIYQRDSQTLSGEQNEGGMLSSRSDNSDRFGLSRRFSYDSELDSSLSDSSMNYVFSSKDAFLDYVIAGPVKDNNNEYRYLDKLEVNARRRKVKTGTTAKFGDNTSSQTSTTNKRNPVKKFEKVDFYGRARAQPQDDFGVLENRNRQQIMGRNSAQRRHLGREDSPAAQQLAEMLTANDDETSAKNLGQKPRQSPETAQMSYGRPNASGGLPYLHPSKSSLRQPFGDSPQTVEWWKSSQYRRPREVGGVKVERQSSNLNLQFSQQSQVYELSHANSLHIPSRAMQVDQARSLALPKHSPEPQTKQFPESDHDDHYEDTESDSTATGSEILRNTEYNAMIDLAMENDFALDALIPSPTSKPRTKRNVSFYPITEKMHDSGDKNFSKGVSIQAPFQQAEQYVRSDSNAESAAVIQKMTFSSQTPPKLNLERVKNMVNALKQGSQQQVRSPLLDEDPDSPGIYSPALSTASTAFDLPPSRIRKKVRHVQLQTKRPNSREVYIQTDPVTSTPTVSNSHSQSLTLEREQELEASNKAMSEQSLTLSSQLTVLQASYQNMYAEMEALRKNFDSVYAEKEQIALKIEDNKIKFDKLSQQALKKIRELLNERQDLEVDIDGLKVEVEAIEEKHREWATEIYARDISLNDSIRFTIKTEINDDGITNEDIAGFVNNCKAELQSNPRIIKSRLLGFVLIEYLYPKIINPASIPQTIESNRDALLKIGIALHSVSREQPVSGEVLEILDSFNFDVSLGSLLLDIWFQSSKGSSSMLLGSIFKHAVSNVSYLVVAGLIVSAFSNSGYAKELTKEWNTTGIVPLRMYNRLMQSGTQNIHSLPWKCGISSEEHVVFISYCIEYDSEMGKSIDYYFARRRMHCFLDQLCLSYGENFESQFLEAVAKCNIAFFLVSEKTLERMKRRLSKGIQDNVLLEWEHGMQYCQAGLLKIIPVFIGNNGFTFDSHRIKTEILPGLDAYNNHPRSPKKMTEKEIYENLHGRQGIFASTSQSQFWMQLNDVILEPAVASLNANLLNWIYKVQRR